MKNRMITGAGEDGAQGQRHIVTGRLGVGISATRRHSAADESIHGTDDRRAVDRRGCCSSHQTVLPHRVTELSIGNHSRLRPAAAVAGDQRAGNERAVSDASASDRPDSSAASCAGTDTGCRPHQNRQRPRPRAVPRRHQHRRARAMQAHHRSPCQRQHRGQPRWRPLHSLRQPARCAPLQAGQRSARPSSNRWDRVVRGCRRMSTPAPVIRSSIPVAAASKPWGSHATSGRYGRPCPDWHRQHRSVLLLHSLPAQEQQLLQRRSRCHLPSQISPGRIRRSRSPGRCRMHPVSQRRDRLHRAFPVVTASTSWGQRRPRQTQPVCWPRPLSISRSNRCRHNRSPIRVSPNNCRRASMCLPVVRSQHRPASANYRGGRSSMAVAVETPWRTPVTGAAATNRLAC